MDLATSESEDKRRCVFGGKALMVVRNLLPYHRARAKYINEQGDFDLVLLEVFSNSEYSEIISKQDYGAMEGIVSLGLQVSESQSVMSAEIQAALERLKPDVVFVPGWSMRESLIAMRVSSKMKVPVVIMSDSNRFDFARHTIKEFIKKRIVSIADAGFVAGTPQMEYLDALGMPLDRIFLGYDVVDNAAFEQGAIDARTNKEMWRTSLNLPKRFILSICRLVEKKNVFRLIEGFAEFINGAEAQDISLVVAGPGPLKQELEAFANSLGVGQNVYLTGALSASEVMACYGLAEAFVLASKTEQWGLAVNEAMAAGLPVLVSEKCGCATDLVHNGRNGFTFDPLSSSDIAQSIRKVMSSKHKREEMGEHSKTIIRSWGLERFCEGFCDAAEMASSSPRRNSSFLAVLATKIQ